jgi:glucokinase
MYFLFDIGGTNLRVASSRDGKKIDAVRKFSTPQKFSAALELFRKTKEELAGSEKIVAVAGGVAGPLDREKTKLVKTPNISDNWKNKPLKKELEKIFGCTVLLENDCVMVGLGEAAQGSGKGKEIVAYITISTGVGGARFVGGKPDRNTFGFEPGHQYIPSGDSLESWEACVSGAALQKKYGKPSFAITDLKIWEEEARLIALGLANTIVHWSPEMVILGGSVMKKVSIKAVRKYLNEFLTIFPCKPKLVKAKLGDSAGFYGALSLLRTARR